MNTRLLESFLVVASELNITRAAAQLHLTQQTLSAQVRHLERELGAELLVRDSRGVRLTPAGQAFAAGAERVVNELNVLVGQVRAVDAAAVHTLRVVCCPRATAPFMIRVADAVEAANPDVRIELTSVRTIPEGLRILDSGRADAGLLWAPVIDIGLHHSVIGSEPWVAALDPGHRLAARTSVTLAELGAEPVALPAIFVSEAAEQHWLAALRADGAAFDPAVRDTEDGPILAARRQGVWLAPRSLARRYTIDGLVLIPVSDAPSIDAAVVWTTRAPGAPIRTLIDAVRAAVERPQNLFVPPP
ncbi:LysR family transcriptional regulator [Nocardia sp. 2]|uniref:LysR family transcriptional regulator n=1 Tax=Nocardia acididurans TaxID=2802282 RepID=A0ABS1M5K7_9NOCA|nr:LysR family transcriptional regulator [Nocardia acididurans]MBL1075345.1 LysR family transcriptional regulator [Nocardia acididurans]